jgi:meiotically up-regulated gene 157 (Mug157) protein
MTNLKKPYDVGNGIIAASLDHNGRLLSMSKAHKGHFCGYSPNPGFPNDKWYDPSFVREYRIQQAITKNGFGLVGDVKESTLDHGILTFDLDFNGLKIKQRVCAVKDLAVVLMEFSFDAESDKELVFNGKLGLLRSSYAQITERNPTPIPEGKNTVILKDKDISIFHDGLSLHGGILSEGFSGDYQKDSPSPLEVDFNHSADKNKFYLWFYLASSETEVETLKTKVSSLTPEQVFKQRNVDWDSYKKLASGDVRVAANLDYIRNCCCFDSGDGALAMLTEHQLLPLTWNRDNYYMLKPIMAVLKKHDVQDFMNLIQGHLKWLFKYLKNGYWGRSHFISGEMKDDVYQLDQQLYPLLEIYDFWKLGGDVESYLSRVDELIERMLEEMDHETGLFETEENPADDPVLYPYHLSTQILACVVFERLDELNRCFKFSARDFQIFARELRASINKYMIVEVDGKQMFCYTCDESGNFELYHDANDLPLALAPHWGFCDHSEPVLQNTIEWSFSDENEGWYSGDFSGLGSKHAPGKWPLGDLQELMIALYEGNSDKIQAIDSHLSKSFFMDGLLPESVDSKTGEFKTRSWFAWPGAVYAWLKLEELL